MSAGAGPLPEAGPGSGLAGAAGRGAIPAPRLAALLLVGAPLLVPAWGGVWAWFLAYNGLVAAVALLDLLLAAPPGALAAGRRVERVLALGRPAPVHLAVANRGRRPVRLLLVDDLTPGLAEPPWPLRADLAPGAAARLAYRVTATARGDQALGALHGRYPSPLGLWYRRVRWDAREAVRVYPALTAARDWELALKARTPRSGLRRTRLKHGGTELESLREYLPGDPIRSVNWPASARRGRLIVNEYRAERSQAIILALDLGRQMAPYLEGRPRLDHALEALLLLGWVGAAEGDRVGLMLLAASVEAWLPPRPGRAAVARLLDATYAVAPQMVEPDYSGALAFLRGKQRKRGLVVLFTDLGDPLSSRDLAPHAAALAREHLVLVVAQTDPELLRLSRLAPDSSPEAYQKAAAIEALARREEAKAHLQQAGVLVVDVPPGHLSAAVVNQYLELKQQGRV